MSKIIVVGAGLVGPVIAMYLARSGREVEVWEKRADPRHPAVDRGSSVNLTLCSRGLASLAELGLEAVVRAKCVPVYGRVIHDTNGSTMVQRYGNHKEAIYSVSRAGLNKILIDEAERLFNIPFRFNHSCIDIDPQGPAIVFRDKESGKTVQQKADVICAADGVHSMVRTLLSRQRPAHLSRGGAGTRI